MLASTLLRRRLACSILGALGAAALAPGCQAVVVGGDGAGGTGADGAGAGGPTGQGAGQQQGPGPTTGVCYPAAGGNTELVCVGWPPAPSGAGGSGGFGTGTGMGGAGSGPPCPSAQEAVESGVLGFSGCGFTEVLEPTQQGNQCCYTVTYACCSGRPFLVADRAHTAAVREGAKGSSWTDAERPACDNLSDGAREILAEAWLRDALLEHASVASFARFALELLAVGAPSELLDAAHEAARDEVRHARMCFSLASTYAGRELAPGPFDFGGAVEVSSDLAAVARSAVNEGCIGETLAAVQAAEQREAATDPVVRNALMIIAEDEARHAELAWRFVAWAIETGGEVVRASVARAFDEILDTPMRVAAVPVFNAELAAHGRVADATLDSAFRATIDEVIRPAVKLLTARRSAAATRVTVEATS